MKKLKLFPKTFLYTFFLLLLINLSMHLMIYFFYPKVYLNRMEKDLENKIQELHEEIAVSTESDHRYEEPKAGCRISCADDG